MGIFFPTLLPGAWAVSRGIKNARVYSLGCCKRGKPLPLASHGAQAHSAPLKKLIGRCKRGNSLPHPPPSAIGWHPARKKNPPVFGAPRRRTRACICIHFNRSRGQKRGGIFSKTPGKTGKKNPEKPVFFRRDRSRDVRRPRPSNLRPNTARFAPRIACFRRYTDREYRRLLRRVRGQKNRAWPARYSLLQKSVFTVGR